MRSPLFFFLLFFATCTVFVQLFSTLSYGEQGELENMLNTLKNLEGWTASFEEILLTSGSAVRKREGTITFSKPFSFKVSYKDAEVLSDGNLLYYVIHSKKRVYVKPITQEVSQTLIMDILSGDFRLGKFFDVREVGEGMFQLSPINNSLKDVRQITIKTMNIGFPVRSIKISLRGDTEIEIKINSVKYGQRKIDFSFPGYKIIKESVNE